MWGLQPDLESQVRNKLQIIKLYHNLQDPQDLTDLYNVASFILQGSPSAASLILSPLASALLEVKMKTQSEMQALKTAFTKFTKMFKNLLQQSSQRSLGLPPTCPTGEAMSKCNFCGVPGHFMCKCKVAAEYMCLSKCKCNAKGKIVLLAGEVVPQHITEAWLHDCIDKYHQINPGQIAAEQMLMEMAASIAQITPTLPEASQFSISKVVHFNPEVGQPGVFAYKQQFQTRSTITSKGKELQGLARIAEVHTNESNSKVGPSKFTWEFPPHKLKPIELKAQLTAKHPYVKALNSASLTENALTVVSQPPV